MAREVAAGVCGAGTARQGSLVTGWAPFALAGDAPEEPRPPEPQDCDSPVACATFPGTSGIPGLCQLWHPTSARLCHHPFSLLRWGQGIPLSQLGAPQSRTSLGDIRVSDPVRGFPWQLPWGWWHILPCALPARCAATAAGSCSGASRLAGVFIEQIAPSCFCCKASASESEDLPSTSGSLHSSL